METLQVILIFAVLIGAVALMMTKKLPAILALPLIGILVAAVAGVPFFKTTAEDGQTISSFVIVSGSARLAGTIIVTIFGAIFAKVIEKKILFVFAVGFVNKSDFVCRHTHCY